MIVPLKPFNWVFHLSVFCALAIGMYVFRHGFAFDRSLSDLFFQNGQWLWPKQDKDLTFWLHEFIKYVFILIGILALFVYGAGKYFMNLKPYRYTALLVSLSLSIMPLVIGQLKAETSVFCPSKLERYGGSIPNDYYRVPLKKEELRQARCFPAAHASPGFALLILGVSAATRRRKVIGYAIGLSAGLALSIIQIGRGEHFLTHCIFSALIALWISYLLSYSVNALHREGWI